MQHVEHIPARFPWRAATLVVGVVAFAELVALISIGVVHVAPKRQAQKTAAPAAAKPVRALPHATVPSHPLRARDAVRVLVLNANGVSGAAATQAQHLELQGYRIGGTANAQRHDYAQSMVLYVPGWVKEARRLARDTGVRMVAPVDGLPPAQLKGSKIVLLLGT